MECDPDDNYNFGVPRHRIWTSLHCQIRSVFDHRRAMEHGEQQRRGMWTDVDDVEIPSLSSALIWLAGLDLGGKGEGQGQAPPWARKGD